MALVVRLFVVACAAIALAGCVTPRSMSLQDARSLRAVEVSVRYADNASVTWANGPYLHAEAKGFRKDEDGRYAEEIDTPEARAWARQEALRRVTNRMQPIIKEGLKGSRPVRVEVTIFNLSDLGVGARILTAVLIGDVAPRMGSRIRIVDVGTGREIEQMPPLETVLSGPAGGLVGAAVLATVEAVQTEIPFERLAARQANEFVTWLLRE